MQSASGESLRGSQENPLVSHFSLDNLLISSLSKPNPPSEGMEPIDKVATGQTKGNKQGGVPLEV